jgi:hypothetical protein
VKSLRSHRADLVAVGVLMAVPVVLFADVLFFRAALYYRDLTFYFYPSNRLISAIVRGGEFPFWNPYYSAGQPLAANPEFSIFYPPRWLILLPDFDFGFKLHLLVHIAIGLIGMYFLLRSMRARPESSLLGALSFGLGGLFLSYINIPPFLFTLAWLPAVIALARRFLLRPRLPAYCAAALIWGLQLTAGEPTTVLQTGMIVGSLAIYLGLLQADDRWRAVARNLGLVLLLSIGAAAVGAVQIVPALDHVRETSRAEGLPWESVSFWSTPPVRIVELAFPDFMGPHEDNYRWRWGSGLYRDHREPYLQSLFFGLPLLLFALAGMMARRSGYVLTLVLFAGGWILAVGEHTPLLRFLYEGGIFRSFRYPEKFLLLALVPTIIFGALMLDRALRGDRRIVRNAALLAAGCTFAALAAWGSTWSDAYVPAARSFWKLPDDAALEILLAASRQGWVAAAVRGGVVLLLIAVMHRVPRTTWAAALFAVLLFDLGSESSRIVPRTHDRYFDAPPVAEQLDPQRSGYRILHRADLEEKVALVDPGWRGSDSYFLLRNAMYPRMPASWGFRTVLEHDYDETNLRPTLDLHRAALTFLANDAPSWPGSLAPMSNIRYVARHPAAGPYTQRGEDDPAFVQPLEFVDLGASPRYYFASRMERVEGWQDFAQLLLSGRADPGAAFVGFPAAQTGRGTVRRVTQTANSIALDVSAAGQSYLVLSVTPHKYWKAAIDGVPAELHVTNIGYQGLWVPQGEHVVRLVYRNTLVIFSGVVSAVAATTFVILAVVFRRRP